MKPTLYHNNMSTCSQKVRDPMKQISQRLDPINFCCLPIESYHWQHLINVCGCCVKTVCEINVVLSIKEQREFQ